MEATNNRFWRVIRSGVLGAMAFVFFQPAIALFDLNENGLGDFWELYYDGGELDADGDEDGDGNSNGYESLIGSDPFDPESYFGLNGYRFENNNRQLVFNFQALEGMRYYIESTSSLHPEASWRRDQTILSNGTGALEVEFFLNSGFERTRYFRVGQETDEDQDGLTAWEEGLLGFSDRDPNSNGGNLSDLSWAFDRHFSGYEIVIGEGIVLPGATRPIEEASRFLNQATFGPTYEMIEELHDSGKSYAEWIDAQIAMAPTTLAQSIAAELSTGAQFDHKLFHRGWWRSAVQGQDQLRQRMAFALSQILVVSGQGADLIRGSSEAAGSYYDILLNNAFGNYADLLEEITYHPGMGIYLGHFRNQKANPEFGTFPDENYARELMQLFSIGLWELNEDGTKKLDYKGAPIPSYTNFHVTELAKVMTGFNWGGTNSFNGYLYRPELPMTIWDDYHDRGEKFLVNGGHLPPRQLARNDVRLAVENLVNHPSAGPFIGRLLIQRFVTSNPSPGYIRRVALVFADNGKGERGDLGAVIRAILLDQEARGENQRTKTNFGKMREPYVTYVHLSRGFEAKNEAENFAVSVSNHLDSLGQLPLMAPSVFNFYLPDYQPSIELGREDLVAPEFQILTPLISVSWANLLRTDIELGAGYLHSNPEATRHHDYSAELDLVATPNALIDRLDLIFTYGKLRSETREIIRSAMNGQRGNLSDEQKLSLAIYLVMTSPEYAILR
jgi:uncharacterized protein (DUF1800 family)